MSPLLFYVLTTNDFLGISCRDSADRSAESEVHRKTPGVCRHIPRGKSCFQVQTRLLLHAYQRRANVTDEVIDAFMDKNRQIEPTIGKCKAPPQAQAEPAA
jgi:hypothetical protein